MAGRSLPTKQISSVAMTTSKAQFDPTGLSATHGVRPAEAWNLFDGFLVLSQAESGGFYHGFCRLFRGLSWILREFSQLLMYLDCLAAYAGGMVKLLGGDTNAANYPGQKRLMWIQWLCSLCLSILPTLSNR